MEGSLHACAQGIWCTPWRTGLGLRLLPCRPVDWPGGTPWGTPWGDQTSDQTRTPLPPMPPRCVGMSCMHCAGCQADTMCTPNMCYVGICTGKFSAGRVGRAVLPQGTPPRWQPGLWHYTSGAFEFAGKPCQTSVPKEQLHRQPQFRVVHGSSAAPAVSAPA